MLEVPQHDSGTWSAESPYILGSTLDLKQQTNLNDDDQKVILLNEIVVTDVSKEKNVGTWMDSLLLTTLAAFYYDFLLEASSEVATISEKTSWLILE